MSEENFSELTTEALIKKKKQASLATGILTGMLIGLLTIAILQTINKGFSYLLIIPFALSPILFVNYKQISNMNKELQSRNSK